MFEVFYLDVAYISMTLYACLKYIFQVFQTHVASVSSEFYKSRSRCTCCYCNTCFKHCFKYFICFRRMLQVFYLDILKVDMREHMLQ
jgi:hypothetical protein